VMKMLGDHLKSVLRIEAAARSAMTSSRCDTSFRRSFGISRDNFREPPNETGVLGAFGAISSGFGISNKLSRGYGVRFATPQAYPI